MYLIDSATRAKDISNILSNWDMQIDNKDIFRVEVWGTTFDEAVANNGDYCVIKIFDINGKKINECKKAGY